MKSESEQLERTVKRLDKAKPRHVRYGIEMEMGTIGLLMMKIQRNIERYLVHKDKDECDEVLDDIDEALDRLDDLRLLITDFRNFYIR